MKGFDKRICVKAPFCQRSTRYGLGWSWIALVSKDTETSTIEIRKYRYFALGPCLKSDKKYLKISWPETFLYKMWKSKSFGLNPKAYQIMPPAGHKSLFFDRLSILLRILLIMTQMSFRFPYRFFSLHGYKKKYYTYNFLVILPKLQSKSFFFWEKEKKRKHLPLYKI